MNKHIVLLFFVFLPLFAYADIVEGIMIDGVYYNIVTKAKIAEVTRNPNKYSGNIVIPETVNYKGTECCVKTILESAFQNCTGLISITIPNSVTSIENSAFDGCCNLTSVIIGKNVTSIGWGAFSVCSSLTSISLPNSLRSIEPYAFYACNNIIYIDIPDNVVSIGSNVFENCYGLCSVTLPNSLTKIEDYAFGNCFSLVSITIPNSVLSIGDFAFQGCQSLSSVTIPNSVTKIGQGAFEVCKKLPSVTIPNSVRSIGESAFAGCDSLKTVSIGRGIVEIFDYAFAYCQELTDVYCYAYNVPTNFHSNVFEHSYTKYATLHVPSSSISKYQTATSWKDFGSIVSIDDNTEESSSYIRESMDIIPETDIDEDRVYSIAELMPSFKGNVSQWLSQNLTYPAAAAENNIQGIVIVKFIVDKHGNVSNVQVVRSVDPSLDREAVNTVKRMPKWNPGMQNGQPVKVWYTLPVTFKLQQ